MPCPPGPPPQHVRQTPPARPPARRSRDAPPACRHRRAPRGEGGKAQARYGAAMQVHSPLHSNMGWSLPACTPVAANASRAHTHLLRKSRSSCCRQIRPSSGWVHFWTSSQFLSPLAVTSLNPTRPASSQACSQVSSLAKSEPRTSAAAAACCACCARCSTRAALSSWSSCAGTMPSASVTHRPCLTKRQTTHQPCFTTCQTTHQPCPTKHQTTHQACQARLPPAPCFCHLRPSLPEHQRPVCVAGSVIACVQAMACLWPSAASQSLVWCGGGMHASLWHTLEGFCCHGLWGAQQAGNGAAFPP